MNSVTSNETTTPAKRGPGRPRTKITQKRVVLIGGQPVGRGRPKKDSKGERTVVYIPKDETYDSTKHGLGVKFISGLNQFKLSIKRVNIPKK
jgi:hypothetical protein